MGHHRRRPSLPSLATCRDCTCWAPQLGACRRCDPCLDRAPCPGPCAGPCPYPCSFRSPALGLCTGLCPSHLAYRGRGPRCPRCPCPVALGLGTRDPSPDSNRAPQQTRPALQEVMSTILTLWGRASVSPVAPPMARSRQEPRRARCPPMQRCPSRHWARQRLGHCCASSWECLASAALSVAAPQGPRPSRRMPRARQPPSTLPQ